MKKLLIMFSVLALAGSFLPNAQAQDEDSTRDSGTAELELSVIFKKVEPVMAIELNETSWVLYGVGLGEKRDNGAKHGVRNIGNVAVGIDIGYVDYTGCEPDLKPGVDRFATEVKDAFGNLKPIPPDGRVEVASYLRSTGEQKILLIHYSPTELTEYIKGMSATYELRAYPPIMIVE